jgi:hypothetical protein
MKRTRIALLLITAITAVWVFSSCRPEVNKFPAEFPLSGLTEQQIMEVAHCDIEALASERYPENLETGQLLKSFSPKSNCDWAVLAYADAIRSQANIPSQVGLDAFRKSISRNYGFALKNPVFDYYFGTIQMVNNPQMVKQEITKVEIQYSWYGLGDPGAISYSASIDQADTSPVVSTSTEMKNNHANLDKETVQELAQGLDNLLPINTGVPLVYCTDNFPEWSVVITFADGSKLDLETSSNFLYFGGPWQVQIGGQTYIQYSDAFARRLKHLIEELQLPIGEPEGMYCNGEGVFENAFNVTPLPPQSTNTPIPSFIGGEPVSAQAIAKIVGGNPAYWVSQDNPLAIPCSCWSYSDLHTTTVLRHPGENMVLSYEAKFGDPKNANDCQITVHQEDLLRKFVKCPTGTKAEIVVDQATLYLYDTTGYFP